MHTITGFIKAITSSITDFLEYTSIICAPADTIGIEKYLNSKHISSEADIERHTRDYMRAISFWE
jgi:hypothetical protein